MKRKTQYKILLAEALILTVLAIIPTASLGIFTGIMSFPFEQIALILRMLSLSGALGNTLAIGLYAAICLLPMGLFFIRKNRRFNPEDALIPLLSLTLFAVIYQMINPGTITLMSTFAQDGPMAKAVLGATAYSIILGYIILRVLRLFYGGSFNEVLSYMSVLLFTLNILFVAVIFYGGLNEAVTSIKNIHINNSASTHLFAINYFFLALAFIVKNLPYALNILIVFSAMALLKNFTSQRYSDETLASAARLSNICGLSLAVIVPVNIGYNISQLLFAHKIFTVNSSISLPVFSIVFVLACLLFVKLLQENKTLKDESDSFI